MSIVHACLAVLVLVDPIGTGGAATRARSIVAASRVPLTALVVGFVAAAFVIAAVLAVWFLDLLRVTAPDAMVAAGFLALIPAAVRCVHGRAEDLLPREGDVVYVPWPAWRLALVPLALPIAASPAGLATVVAVRADAGFDIAIAAIFIALVGLANGCAWIRRSEDGRLRRTAVRLMGVAMIVVAVSLIYEGIFVA